MQNDAKKAGKLLKPWQMGTQLRVLSESFPMNTNMTGFRWFSKNLCILVLWAKVASALEGLSINDYCYIYFYYILYGTAILAITSLYPKIDMFSSKHDTHCTLSNGVP